MRTLSVILLTIAVIACGVNSYPINDSQQDKNIGLEIENLLRTTLSDEEFERAESRIKEKLGLSQDEQINYSFLDNYAHFNDMFYKFDNALYDVLNRDQYFTFNDRFYELVYQTNEYGDSTTGSYDYNWDYSQSTGSYEFDWDYFHSNGNADNNWDYSHSTGSYENDWE